MALLEHAPHQGISQLITDLNRLYKETDALYFHDFEPEGFEWITNDDSSQSVLAYMRKYEQHKIIVMLNFTPVPRENYRIGVAQAGIVQEILNSDASVYGGNNVGKPSAQETEAVPRKGHDHSISLTLPPLAGIVLRLTESTVKTPVKTPIN